MNMLLTRKEFTDKSTIGILLVDGLFECFTLEDAVRDSKVYGKTAIPYGKYEVIVSYSNRFKRRLPLLLKVKNYEGIRIHPGNTDRDTEGCILVGQTKGKDFIGQSVKAFNALFSKIERAEGKVYIEIIEET